MHRHWINFKTFESKTLSSKSSVLDACYTYFLYLSIGLHASIFIEIVENLMSHTFHELSLLPGLGRTLVLFLHHAWLVESRVNHRNWLTFCRTCESRGSKQEDVDDGVGMHGYLLCTV
jgi:hypothetical protein